MLRIKELRKEKNLTQSELANLLATTTANISGWETDKWQPDIYNLIKMSDIFECTIDYLVGREFESGAVYFQTSLTEDEKLLLNIFKDLKPNNKRSICEFAKILLDNQQ